MQNNITMTHDGPTTGSRETGNYIDNKHVNRNHLDPYL